MSEEQKKAPAQVLMDEQRATAETLLKYWSSDSRPAVAVMGVRQTVAFLRTLLATPVAPASETDEEAAERDYFKRWENELPPSASVPANKSWFINVSGPAGYTRRESFSGATLEDALDSVRAQGLAWVADEDGKPDALQCDGHLLTDPADIDDNFVDRFAVAMKEKLAVARAKGREGWQHCDPAELSCMLREHVEKGDPIDVANFCMFLWALCQPITDYVLPMGKRSAPAPAAQAGKQTNIETLRKGFKTSRVCGPDNLYEISIKFRSIEDLHTADDELRALMLAAIVARQHQSGEAQASGQAPAAGAGPAKRGWPAIDKAIKDYLEDYELRADEGSHTPTEGERFLIYDAISGLLSEDEFLALLAAPVAARAPAVPLGLAVVPSEPTQEMRLGAWLAWKTFEGECEDERMQAALREAIASSPTVASAVPDGMIERIKAAEQRIYDNQAPRRIPADPTDVDLVLAEVRMFLEGKPRPFWIKTASTAPASAAPAPLPDERAAFAAAMLAAGARDYGGNTWEWDDADFLFKFWKQARSTAASEDKPDADRYRGFCDAGWPISFLGEMYTDKASLDAAIDAAIAKGDGHA